jgi:hypothetical protein
MIVKDGELALWVTERKQMPDGRWRVSVWLNTSDNKLSHQIHKDIATLVKNRMEAATTHYREEG